MLWVFSLFEVYLSFLKIRVLETNTIFWLILFFIIGLAVAYFQYYFKQKNQGKYVLVLFCLKTLSMFLLLLMLLNPEISSNTTENKKPKLYLLSDQSKSISYFKENDVLDKDISVLMSNNELKEKFEILQSIDLHPYDKDHAMVISRYKN